MIDRDAAPSAARSSPTAPPSPSHPHPHPHPQQPSSTATAASPYAYPPPPLYPPYVSNFPFPYYPPAPLYSLPTWPPALPSYYPWATPPPTPPSPPRPPRRRPSRAARSTPVKPHPAAPAAPPSAELERAAKRAVDAADDVTVALLLASWADSLAELQHPGAPAIAAGVCELSSPSMHGKSHQPHDAHAFHNAFHASRALHIVVADLLLTPLSLQPAVVSPLLTLLSRAVYGDMRLHTPLVDAICALNPCPIDPPLLHARRSVIVALLTFLHALQQRLSAYNAVLPARTVDAMTAPVSPTSPQSPSATPAGPDPTKAVDRSLQLWRTHLAVLQLHISLFHILQAAMRSLSHVQPPPHPHLLHFHTLSMRLISAHITADLTRRATHLTTALWPTLLSADATFDATLARANQWLAQLQAARRAIEAQLDEAGLGFGPAASVAVAKMDVLLAASAAVAALVANHQRAFEWANATAKLLHTMVVAFRAVEKRALQVAHGAQMHIAPHQQLKHAFYTRLNSALHEIDNVIQWTAGPIPEKVLKSLEKSSCAAAASPLTPATAGTASGSTPTAKAAGSTKPAAAASPGVGHTQPRLRVRFDEPPKETKQKTSPNRSSDASARPKPRHMRMKSSPDALLHLNTNHFDDDRAAAVNGGAAAGSAAEATKVSTADETTVANGQVSVERASSRKHVGVRFSEHVGSTQPAAAYYAHDDDDDDDDDDRDIIVHEDEDEEGHERENGDDAHAGDTNGKSSAAKKSPHPHPHSAHSSHIRSMSVDGIPF